MAEQAKTPDKPKGKVSTTMVLGGVGLAIGAFALGRYLGREAAEDAFEDAFEDVVQRQTSLADRQEKLATLSSSLSQRLWQLHRELQGGEARG